MLKIEFRRHNLLPASAAGQQPLRTFDHTGAADVESSGPGVSGEAGQSPTSAAGSAKPPSPCIARRATAEGGLGSKLLLAGERDRVEHRHRADGQQAERDPIGRIDHALFLLRLVVQHAAEPRRSLAIVRDVDDKLVDEQQRDAPQSDEHSDGEKGSAQHEKHVWTREESEGSTVLGGTVRLPGSIGFVREPSSAEPHSRFDPMTEVRERQHLISDLLRARIEKPEVPRSFAAGFTPVSPIVANRAQQPDPPDEGSKRITCGPGAPPASLQASPKSVPARNDSVCARRPERNKKPAGGLRRA